jgi:hypothetical protein
VRIDDKAAGEDLVVGDDVGCPVKGVAAIVDSAAALGSVMNSAQELPLPSAHLRAGSGATGGAIEQKPHDQGVALGDEEATELIKPQGLVGPLRRSGKQLGCFAADGSGLAVRVVVVKGSEMLLELEGRVELETRAKSVLKLNNAVLGYDSDLV